jgi:hypothetical protein
MAPPRKIDERDVDRLMAALSDRQIADLFGMPELEVMKLRLSRLPKAPKSLQAQKGEDEDKP